MTKPSSVARHGTMAGTQVRSATRQRPEARRARTSASRAASSAVGQRTAGERVADAKRSATCRAHASGGDALDLDHAAVGGIEEVAGADERHGREVLAEVLAIDGADLAQVRL